MEILITGSISWLAKDFYEELAKNAKVVLCAKGANDIDSDKVTTYDFQMDQLEFEKIFITFNFDKIIYISENMNPSSAMEMAYLEKIMKYCKGKEDLSLIYISPADIICAAYGEVHHIMERACDDMIINYAKQGYNLIRLQVPYLVSKNEPLTFWKELITDAKQNNRIRLEYAREQEIDFLYGSDLAELLNIMLEEGEQGFIQYSLCGKNQMTAQEIENEIQKYIPDCIINYGNVTIESEDDEKELRHKYGWFPKQNIRNDIQTWLDACEVKKEEKKKKGIFSGLAQKSVYVIEFIIMFIICEIITGKTRTMHLMNFIDFRLFFVTISGMMYGMKFGIYAAVASCAAYIIGISDNGNWQIQFYNIINWLPFVTYSLAGCIAGYTKDKYQDEIKRLVKEQKSMEYKYVCLNDLYVKVLENKENYSSQIIKYKNSFGRIYEATKKLNSVLPGEIFYQAVVVLEDMLESRSVAIYSINANSKFARLNACSREYTNKLPKSENLDEIPECFDALKRKETWVNKERKQNYPDYAYGVFNGGILTGMIVLQSADYNQMSMEYMNRFNIVSGLISDALIRANQYQEMSEKEMMLPDTKILKPEFFLKELNAQKTLKENNRANYILMEIKTETKDLVNISEQLLRIIRKNDFIGVGNNNRLYLLLSQADDKTVSLLNQRTKDSAIILEKVEDII